MREKILSFLAQGFSKADVLKATGCSEDLYQEIIEDPSFAQSLSDMRVSLQQSRIEKYYNKLEEKVLRSLTENVELLEPAQQCRVLETVAKNKQLYMKPVDTYGHPNINNTVVLMLPQEVDSQKVVVNQDGQVVSVGDRVMAGLPLQGVRELFANMEAKSKEATQTTRQEIEDDLKIPVASSA